MWNINKFPKRAHRIRPNYTARGRPKINVLNTNHTTHLIAVYVQCNSECDKGPLYLLFCPNCNFKRICSIFSTIDTYNLSCSDSVQHFYPNYFALQFKLLLYYFYLVTLNTSFLVSYVNAFSTWTLLVIILVLLIMYY